jgi:hypothetical protein
MSRSLKRMGVDYRSRCRTYVRDGLERILALPSRLSIVSQDGSGTRIHVIDLAACRTGHRLIYVVVLRNIFGRKA